MKFTRLLPCVPLALLALTCGMESSAAPNPPALRIEGRISSGSYLYTRKGLDGNVDGQALVACIRFDPLSAPNQNGDGTSYRIESSSAKPYVAVALALSGGLSVGNSRASVATPHLTALYRNYVNGAVNEVQVNVTDTQTAPDGAYRGRFHFLWQASDYAGSASTLFVDPNGGVSYFQPLNLAGQVQVGEFNITQLDAKNYTTLQLVGQFVATSVTAVKGC